MSENEKKSVDSENLSAETVTTEAQVETPVEETKPAKKKSVWKVLLKIIGWILIVLAAILLLVLWQIDWIAATATRKVGSMITGTPVDVTSITIKPFAISVKVDNFTVGNPEGFHNPTAIKVGSLYVAVNKDSVLTDKIIVENLEISDVAIDMESTLSQGSNLDALLKNVEKNTGADQKKAEAAVQKTEEKDTEKQEAPAKQKQVIIRKLTLKDSKLTISNSTLKTTMSIPLVPITMENVGEGTDFAGTMQEVWVRLISEIGKAVNFDALGKGIVSGANAVGEGVSTVGKGIVDGADAVGKGIVSGMEGAGKAVDGAVDGTVKLLKKLPGLGE